MEKGWALEKSVSSVVESLQRNGGGQTNFAVEELGKNIF